MTAILKFFILFPNQIFKFISQNVKVKNKLMYDKKKQIEANDKAHKHTYSSDKLCF